MTFKWTKHFRSYDTSRFTGTNSGIVGHPHRYGFTKKNGTTVTAEDPEKFLWEGDPCFLGWHSDDMRSAFPFRKFRTLQEAKEHFNLEPNPVHNARIVSTNFALHNDNTIKMTIEFHERQSWKDFVQVNHDTEEPITHGMKQFRVGVEYDKDHPGGSGHL